MPQSLAKILVHTVFSTKERRPFLSLSNATTESQPQRGPNFCGRSVCGDYHILDAVVFRATPPFQLIMIGGFDRDNSLATVHPTIIHILE